MGACQSCLGRRDSGSYDNDEDTGLLYDDNGVQYGSFGDHMNGETDAVETQRENEAIQTVVARTTSNMVDVFEIAPPPGAGRSNSNNFAYTGQGARLARYQHLVSKLNTEEETSPSNVKVGWLADEDVELQGNNAVSRSHNEDDDALVGTFADAAAAAAPSRATTASRS